ncbi:MAG: MBL fold metallo-hydrolase [Anaerolineae bacterium]|nr:MBL fold metallo-hydrolase [Anaerolineae bacterium]
MEIQFLGAVRTVTGSMHLLEVNGFRLLLECGLFQGRRQESYERNRQLPFDPSSIDAMVLSHAHIDHSGNIPNLVRLGFGGPIYATPATRDLCSAMLQDSGHIQEENAAYVNKRRARQGLPPVEPIYTVADAVACLPSFVSVGYHRPMHIGPGITLTFYDAGHILGSAFVVLDIEENGRTYRLMFSGDVGRRDLPILRDPETVPGVNYLILESTYGNRRHETPQDAERRLREIVNETYRQGGKVIIPAFAVGRTQELVYHLHRLWEARKIPRLPIFVDSPLAVNVTEIFRLHPECYDEEIREFISSNHRKDPFGFQDLRYIRSVEESKELNFLREPAIIISASGMAEHGRILHHLKNNIEDPRNVVLLVGFQAEHTLGRRLLERQPEVRIFGEPYQLRARVELITGYSAHADYEELTAYVRGMELGRLKQIWLVHGEAEAAQSLADKLRPLGGFTVTVPAPGERAALQ